VVFHSVVDMAHKLDLRVVAEGVESEEEAATLLALGCDELQGRYFGAPQPFEEVSKLVVGPLASLLTE
jgi:EAL domain-containing protein (putative c-di-GMP-specific phosphodiesterase class I)